MGRSKAKSAGDPRAGLKRVMEEAGSGVDIWDDLWGSTSTNPEERTIYALMKSTKYDDRAAAIVFGSMLEHALEVSITATLYGTKDSKKHLFSYDEDGVLASFASKISIGYGLGLYERGMRDDLRLIKDIRNVFAHARVRIDFEHAAISAACDALTVVGSLNTKGWSVGHRAGARTIKMTKPREKYTGAIGALSNYLSFFSGLPATDAALSQLYALMYDKLIPRAKKRNAGWSSLMEVRNDE